MNYKDILKKNGISLTKQRLEILGKIEKFHHFSYIDLQNQLKNTGRASIFRNLKLFNEVGIIRIIDYTEGAIKYELNDDTVHHEHMKCGSCNEISEFDDSELHSLFEKISKKNNFKLKKHSLLFEGVCVNCNN
ncbi:transcriptional repressor [Candidatus Gracilibacteria bacterium]|nr:transcriptional repressor [Candidatus Gracilibacteria bacterium]